jgi:hypothetical protein
MADALTGLHELAQSLKRMGYRGTAIARAGVGAGLSAARTAIKSAAPGDVKNEVGARMLKTEGHVVRGVVGLGVGGAAAAEKPHGHLIVLGTVERYRESIGGAYGGNVSHPTQAQLSTGIMPSKPFVRDAYLGALGKITERMRQAVQRSIERDNSRE